MKKFAIDFANIHCDKCEIAIRRCLQSYYSISELDSVEALGNSAEIIFKLADNEVRLYGNDKVDFQHNIKSIVKLLEKIGFEILSWELKHDDETVSSSHLTPAKLEDQHEPEGFFDLVGFYHRFVYRRHKKNHLHYCRTCQENESNKKVSLETEELSSEETVVEVPQQEFRAAFLVTGMTCASCVQSISENLKAILGESKSQDEPNFSVNIIEQSVVTIIPNKQIINKIIDTINDLGFECKLIEVLPVERSINTKVTALIGGMTCSACAISIDSAIKNLPFVLESGINVVTKTAQFVLEDDHGKNIAKLQEAIEDCGFEFQLLTTEKVNYTSGKKKPRSINLKINGMFCTHCPDIVSKYLEKYGDAVVVNDPLTLDSPVIKFTYLPLASVTARKILFDLNHIRDDGDNGYVIDEDKEGPFKCEIVKPVSVDEHVRRLARREVLGIAIRLGIAFVFIIPTFIFGIVAMSLLPKTHKFRIWVEDPLWVGNVSRNSWVLFILATPVYFFAADTFHRKALKEVKSLWFHKNSFKARIFKFGSMNLLMSLGTSVAYFASIALIGLSARQEPMTHHGFHTTYFDSVVFLTFFLLIGKLLQSYSKTKTADAISQLADLKQTEATLIEENGEDVRIDLQLLEIGDQIRIGSGESPPIDCVLVEGESEFDESALTGESTPVKHIEGHQIFSGTVNIGNSSVIGKVTSLEGDSLLNQIVNTVRDGQLRKAPMERTADLITDYFVPFIVACAVITWILWLILAYSGALPDSYLDIDVGGWTVWSLEFAIAVFVIACPCGIGLAAPTALFVGAGLAAKSGILAKGGGVAFQDGANVNIVCFDKTGTLTRGELMVTNYNFPDKNEVIKSFALQVARDLEVSSHHPLAKAIKSFIESYSKDPLTANKVPQVETVPGRGLRGNIILDEGEDTWNQYKPTQAILGNEKLMEENGIEFTAHQKEFLTKWKSESKSVILVGLQCETYFKDDKFHLVFIMAARDQLRPETKKVIEFLQAKSIECWMITGDNKLTADAIAKEIGIDNVVSEVLPDEKQSQIKKIRQLRLGDKKTPVIAMIGDGINDAPALGAADVGIALSSGADLAVTSSDFILLNKLHPLVSLATLLEICRKVFMRVKLNFAWSLVYNMAALPIAAGVIYPYKNSRLDPAWAAAAMALSSVSVVTSSLALKLYRPKLRAEDFGLENDDQEEISPEEEP
ncbi:putative copper-transporting ATPase HMA5 [Candida viswanathii]|uniref:Putative copper-transporting ATPase HMA5 n=1 Tax=Candida viswanathii TaxID=5486 RepID=A0A367YDP5_9ASCO|nr:putative copper-transporting ATPase HMA5 [Candida viswanathii]